jgi:ketosteroid isomerase-like protein
MKRMLLFVFLAAAAWAADPAAEILALERKAMDGWQKGDPEPQLAMADEGITYYHVMTRQRVEGREALRALFEGYRGRPLFDRYEMLEPKLQMLGEAAAVLTYRLAQHNGESTAYWHGTLVYRKTPAGWKLVHSHWSPPGK